MLSHSNREDKELTNVGEMVCLRGTVKKERKIFRSPTNLAVPRAWPWGETAVISNMESTIRQRQCLRPLKASTFYLRYGKKLHSQRIDEVFYLVHQTCHL